MNGLINLNKPSGVTSRDVVNQVQRLVRPAKIGHTGTLDPLADGVLVLCVGSATRLASYVQRMPKQYRATFLLGRYSDTEDTTGDVRLLDNGTRVTSEQVAGILPSFCGTIWQRPPAYSALKIAGRRAYDLARSGQEVELPPRKVVVYELQLVALNYPEMVLEIRCGGGTYVRSLGRDIALALNTAAVMSALTRVAVGRFHVDAAVAASSLNRDSFPEVLLPPLLALDGMPELICPEIEVRKLRQGQMVERAMAPSESVGDELAVVDLNGQLVAIVKRTTSTMLAPSCVFS